MWVGATICPKCGKASADGMLHTKCSAGRGFDGLISAWRYGGAIKKAISGIKFKFLDAAACDIAIELSKQLRVNFPQKLPIFTKDWVLVPIPLHSSRKKWRGFNQSESIGKYVAAEFGWKFVPDLLTRDIETKPQVGLKKEEREENIKGVFSLNPCYMLRSTSYILFDDVWTTGSTMREACRVLKENGAKTVWGLTIAS